MPNQSLEDQAKAYMMLGLIDQSYMDSNNEVSCTQMGEDAAKEFHLSMEDGADVWEWSFEMFHWWNSLGQQ